MGRDLEEAGLIATAAQWHDRYLQQARWTAPLRQYLYERAALDQAHKVLDVGCGTGVLAAELTGRIASQSSQMVGEVWGVDWSAENLSLAYRHAPQARFVCADAHRLPWTAGAFDLALCHYALLWMVDPLLVLQEMHRVIRPGGAVLAIAEPDYGGRVDYPAELEQLGLFQAQALKQQGADPRLGRRLAALFHAAGLQKVETGVMGGQWQGVPDPTAFNSEWDVLMSDLAGIVPQAELLRLQAVDYASWESGERVLFVPTFYALGFG